MSVNGLKLDGKGIMSLINADKYIERLRQTLKDTKSIGVHKLSSTEKFDYLSNRCSDIIRDYDLEYNETLEELWDEQGRKETTKK